jgi:DNA-binding MarR family transcriptional regulator
MATDRDPIREAHGQWLRHGWTEAADGMAMVTSVVRVHQLLMERVESVLRPFNLTFARYEVLRLLSFAQSGPMPMTRLGSLLQVHPTSVTSAVERLVRQGYVERLRRETDRRVVLASLTDAGREVVAEATAGLNADVFERPRLPADDVLRLTELLGEVRAAAGDHVATSVDTSGSFVGRPTSHQ